LENNQIDEAWNVAKLAQSTKQQINLEVISMLEVDFHGFSSKEAILIAEAAIKINFKLNYYNKNIKFITGRGNHFVTYN